LTLIGTFILYLISALNFAIFGRVIMSWVSPEGKDPVSNLLVQITEPILAPLRRIVPTMGMFDLTPMAALLLLNFIIMPLVRTLF
jgi:YggT family protein